MKTIGIIGGVSWFSTAIYYERINQLVQQRLGGSHSARILLHSIDFDVFRVLQEQNDWLRIEQWFTDIARQLQQAGADCIVIATNTVHLVADAISQQLQIPLVHIADATSRVITARHLSKVGLLGTAFVMERAFFRDRLASAGIETILPDEADRSFIHAAVFNELTKGLFTESTRGRFTAIINQLAADGAQGVIFGCTEFGLLLDAAQLNIPVFDTATIHAQAAVDFALAD